MKTAQPTADGVMVRNVVILGLLGVIAVKSIVSGLSETPLATATDASFAGASVTNVAGQRAEGDRLHASSMAAPGCDEQPGDVIAVEPEPLGVIEPPL